LQMRSEKLSGLCLESAAVGCMPRRGAAYYLSLNLQGNKVLASECNPLLEVRPSCIHGLGVYTVKRISKGTRIIEYVGEHLSFAELDTRYDGSTPEIRDKFVFHLGGDRNIDAARLGNDSRFINHSCDPNCESYLVNDRIFIRAVKNIGPCVELTYDYLLE